MVLVLKLLWLPMAWVRLDFVRNFNWLLEIVRSKAEVGVVRIISSCAFGNFIKTKRVHRRPVFSGRLHGLPCWLIGF